MDTLLANGEAREEDCAPSLKEEKDEAMLWSIGFIITFVIGGMTGVLLAVPPANFLVHESMFLVAHFHNVIIGAVLFGALAGLTYWFPKAFGFKLDEYWGKWAFWFGFLGFYVTFMPLYVAGLLGMTRRLQHYDIAMWRPWMLAAAFGVVLLFFGAVAQVVQLAVSIRRRHELRDETGDPWTRSSCFSIWRKHPACPSGSMPCSGARRSTPPKSGPPCILRFARQTARPSSWMAKMSCRRFMPCSARWPIFQGASVTEAGKVIRVNA
jgi:heme/copper-type cytochrome/quinol oxidase subunit 1